ncbi:MAG: InlB B-repeat-containing protein [Paludibacteraceae bacterium]|nr:InlB B-repeat-containing protein [Paludibacteraceae bacterium]
MTTKLFSKRVLWLLIPLLTLFNVSAWGASETAAYTLSCSTSGSNNSYTGNCDITVSSITWNVAGNSQQNPWRFGGKSFSKTDRCLYSKTAIADDITKIAVAFGANSGSITVNSVKLEVYSTAALAAAKGTGDVSSTTISYAASTTRNITVPDGKSWKGRYYCLKMNLTVSGSSNKYITVSSITFYTPTYSVTYNGNGNTGGSVPTDATAYKKGTTVTVKSNSGSLAKTGYTFSGWNTNTSGTGTNYTAGSGTFSITSDITLYAKWVAAGTSVTASGAASSNGTLS